MIRSAATTKIISDALMAQVSKECRKSCSRWSQFPHRGMAFANSAWCAGKHRIWQSLIVLKYIASDYFSRCSKFMNRTKQASEISNAKFQDPWIELGLAYFVRNPKISSRGSSHASEVSRSTFLAIRLWWQCRWQLPLILLSNFHIVQ